MLDPLNGDSFTSNNAGICSGLVLGEYYVNFLSARPALKVLSDFGLDFLWSHDVYVCSNVT